MHLGIDLQLLLAGNLVTFGAAFVRRLTGFGFAMVSVGLLSLFVRPIEAVATTLLLVMVLSVRNIPVMRRSADWHLAGKLTLFGMAGVPVGVATASLVAEDLLRMLIGAGILASLVPMILKPPRVPPAAKAPVAAAGATAGFLNAVAAVPAPPLLVYLMARGDVSLDTRRATLLAIFTLLSLVALAGHLIGGTVQATTVQRAMLMVPGTLLGDVLACRVHWAQNRAFVDRLSMGIVAVSSSLLFGSALFQ
ncbi:sulfite exporter TauE/SafE family protein [Salipiger mucosus]|uniref:Probable membrane transporter protein n=1 Tax=Salipiger mucosus DSM 16094 TaxID=1123237 RepID=S9RBC4_9RHOB|nr:sulfite exporter TauE/SafE family protein [Salipiger mucosus]EPX75435.1 protein of unknown function DUF81 [Salipiger mucosus DSM 16094]